MRPVIVIPGYYGTLLEDRVSKQTVWLTLESILRSGETLDAIRLDSGDPARIVPGSILEEIEILGRWSPNVYKGLLIFLGSLGCNTVAFGVDWRQSVHHHVEPLHQRIQGVLSQAGANKVDIVAHSHGGLVARAYLQAHGGALVEQLITFGTPHKGMLETFRALREGNEFMGFSKSHIMKVARTFPSAYELLPTDPDDGLFTIGTRPGVPFDDHAWVTGGISRTLLADAGSAIRRLPLAIPVKTTMVVGTHRRTWARAKATNGEVRFIEAAEGDGTVPAVSASGSGMTASPGLSRFVIPYGVHSRLFEYAAAKRVLRNAVLDRPAPHYASSFAGPTYTPGKPIGLGVDVRDPAGNPYANARVSVELRGRRRETHVLSQTAQGDYHVEIPTAKIPVHLEYRITVEGPPQPFDPEVGMLWAANHY